jgi:uncharacterized YigZ family protein
VSTMWELKKEFYQSELTIKKSRFITFIGKVQSKADLDLFIAKYSAKDARHNCYAYRYLVNTAETQGSDNDGEPTGTSGNALLRFIELKNVTNICILVVRYFGGIKLGTGPLTRAYVAGAKELLKPTELINLTPQKTVTFCAKITSQKQIQAFLRKKGCETYHIDYDNDILTFQVQCHDDLDLAAITHLFFRKE